MKRLLVVLLIFAFCIILCCAFNCRKKKNIKDIYDELKENPDVQEVYYKLNDEILPEIQQLHENIISHEQEAKNQYEDIKNMYNEIQYINQEYKSHEGELKTYYNEFEKDYNYIKSHEDELKTYYDEAQTIDKVIKPLKKLYYNKKLNIKCVNLEGKHVAPIKTNDGYRCEHYYVTTNSFNGLPFGASSNGNTCQIGNINTMNDYFNNCNNNNGCSCDISAWNRPSAQMMYAAYGAPSDGLISGYRVDYPADINHPVFMRIDNVDAKVNFDNHTSTTSQASIEDCESVCNNFLNNSQGCFSYVYDPTTQQCISEITTFNNGYSFVRA